MTRLPTASGLDLVRMCSGSATLPRVEEISEGMTAGSARHRYLQRVNEIRALGIEQLAARIQALAEIADATHRAMCEALDLEGLPLDPVAYVAEVAFAWNVRTGEARELGRGLARDYSSATEDEIVGTADTIALVGDDGVFVSDFKSRFDHQPNLARHMQLRFLAVAACRAYGRERAVIEIIRPGDESAWRERADLDEWDLIGVESDLRQLVSEIERSTSHEPRFVVGGHCRRCRSMRFCPAMTSLARAVTGDDPEAIVVRNEGGGELTSGQASILYHRLEAADAAIKTLWEVLDAYTFTAGPVRIDDDRVYGPVRVRRESLVGSVAWKVLEEAYGADVAWSATDVRVTKAALDRVARAQLQPGQKITHAVRDLLSRIAERGGVKAKEDEVVKVHRIKESE